MVRQLFHLGVIEAFSGTLKRPVSDKIKPFDTEVDPQTLQEVHTVLQGLNIVPKVTKL